MEEGENILHRQQHLMLSLVMLKSLRIMFSLVAHGLQQVDTVLRFQTPQISMTYDEVAYDC